MDFLNPDQCLHFLQHLVDIQRDIAQFDGAIAQVVQTRRRQRVGNRRVVWVRPWLLRRQIYGHYEHYLLSLIEKIFWPSGTTPAWIQICFLN